VLQFGYGGIERRVGRGAIARASGEMELEFVRALPESSC